MTKKTELSDVDKAAFQEAMKGIKRLSQKPRHMATPPALPLKRKPHTTFEEEKNLFQFSDYETHESVDSQTLIEYFRPGIQLKIVRKMRAGQFQIEAKLDLHGMIVAEARETLAHFIADCQQRNIRQILIIHGKGRANVNPILKNKLNHWLRQTENILAFCSAKSKEGGTGALYVLLKRST